MKSTAIQRFMRRFTFQLTCCAALAACDGGSGSNANPPPTGPTGPVATQIQAMEDQGKLPKLDRSTEIKGPDVNNDGVRDDVAKYIEQMPISQEQKVALNMDAKSIQSALLVDLNNKMALNSIANDMGIAIRCVFERFGDDHHQRNELILKIKAVTLNTKERSLRWVKYNQAMNGYSSPETVPGEERCG